MHSPPVGHDLVLLLGDSDGRYLAADNVDKIFSYFIWVFGSNLLIGTFARAAGNDDPNVEYALWKINAHVIREK